MRRGRLIAWFGREYFAAGLRDCGWRVEVFSYHEPRVFSWADILGMCGRVPDVLVLGDRSHPPSFLGLESYPCLTVFYSVDSHIHSWHPLYAQAFDAVLAGLKDDIPRFVDGRLSMRDVLWSPAYAPDPHHMAWTPAQPEFDVLFAGTVDVHTTPGRAVFLESLGRELPELAVRQGHFLELFPKGKIVLNVAERGDLNFRVFEALAMGKPLLTPRTGNGLLELFEEDQDLLTYLPGDVTDCAAKARYLLADPVSAQRMGVAGLAKVNAQHRASHRARAFAAFLEELFARGNGQRLTMAAKIRREVIRPLHLHWAAAHEDSALKAAWLADAKRV